MTALAPFIEASIKDGVWTGGPIEGSAVITQGFGVRSITGNLHRGYDLAVDHVPVKAVCDGIVHCNTWGDFGFWVVQETPFDGWFLAYCHLSKFLVTEGEFVKKGEVLGVSGGTPGTPGAGTSDGAHLHFELNNNVNVSADIKDAADLALYLVKPEEEIDMAELEKLAAQVTQLQMLVAGNGIDIDGDGKIDLTSDAAVSWLLEPDRDSSLAGAILNQNRVLIAIQAKMTQIEEKLDHALADRGHIKLKVPA